MAIDIHELINHAQDEIGKVGEIHADVETRIDELETLKIRAEETMNSANDYIENLENLANALDDIEGIIDDASYLGVY
tara:strand:+ start:2019 stop:2252 length:234 start_codon:yes stop_codon:yes gene_type:complete